MAKRSGHAGRIVALRKALKITQGALAKHLRVGQPVVAGWESGKKKYGPTPKMFLRLGNFASKRGRYEDALWFFEKAGVERESFLFAANERRKEQTTPAEPDEVAPVQPSQKVPEQAGLPTLRFPAKWIPNPDTTTYVLLSDEYHKPLFRAGDILVIDESETDWRKLSEAFVVLYLPPPKEIEPVSEAEKNVARQTLAPGKEFSFPPTKQYGVFAGWLFFDITDMEARGARLLAVKPIRGSRMHERAILGVRFSDEGPVEDPAFESLFLDLEREEKPIILGRVVAWIPQVGPATPAVQSQMRTVKI